MRIHKIIGLAILISFFFSCEKMDDNYKEYLDRQKVYSPKINNLSADVGLKTATLYWENPEGEIAKKIFIDYKDDSLKYEQLVDSAVLDNLEIKGYDVSVYTIDAFNNYSVPVTIQIFPNGEN